MNDDTKLIVCATVASQPLAIPGSRKEYCTICAAEVWLSPEGQTFQARETDTTIVCYDCGVGIIAQDKEAKMMPVPGATRYGPVGPGMREIQRRVRERKEQS